ncbi:LOW QUALITY PROTEIN: copper homeostasis protein cutC homolog [Ruditapes philippinarum]|uniref:LOW QUALITY PROTEIN: copper homeostasis protein cutC homolog n=1 Tax=Ruditapes philippinarum TaxID=129788 RepID=UPI00295AA8F0|nr:LOW QUALITY PROTEIN: copper homeostasis protein cutC homolog [Ruditapes philippinarum]
MEVCIDSVQSAINAEKGGAVRVELCANLMEGGTTPSIGMLKVIKATVKIPVFVMIRPRGGDFTYFQHEFDVMFQDLCMLKETGADGFVFGILNKDGTIEEKMCEKLLEYAKPLPCTFHRAIDMTRDISEALEKIISLGFGRVLTSGGDSSALEGLPVIAGMVKQAGKRIIIMPGGGINEKNLQRILEQSGATEFHCSARSSVTSQMTFQKQGISMGASLTPPEFSVKVTDDNKVKNLVTMASNFWGT